MQEEDFSVTFFDLSDYELQNSEELLTSVTLPNSMDISCAEENLEIPSSTPDPVEKKARENVREQRTRVEP